MTKDNACSKPSEHFTLSQSSQKNQAQRGSVELVDRGQG